LNAKSAALRPVPGIVDHHAFIVNDPSRLSVMPQAKG